MRQCKNSLLAQQMLHQHSLAHCSIVFMSFGIHQTLKKFVLSYCSLRLMGRSVTPAKEGWEYLGRDGNGQGLSL